MYVLIPLVTSYLLRIYVHTLQVHCYQPMWTLVGGGVKQLAQSSRPMQDVMPKKATWFKSAVAEFNPDENALVTASGDKVSGVVLG